MGQQSKRIDTDVDVMCYDAHLVYCADMEIRTSDIHRSKIQVFDKARNDRPWTLKVKRGARNAPIGIDSGAIHLFEI